LEFNSPTNPVHDENIKPNKRNILVFHCEFSSERAPTLLRYLREKDRTLNLKNYPLLNHPEAYILDGGYKAFFEKHKDLCEPQMYLQMHSKDHDDDLKYYRAQTKDGRSLSWTGSAQERQQ